MRTFEQLTEEDLRTVVELAQYMCQDICTDSDLQPLRYLLRGILGFLPAVDDIDAPKTLDEVRLHYDNTDR